MLIVMNSDATQLDISSVMARAESFGMTGHLVRGVERTAIAVTGEPKPVMRDHFIQMQGVNHVVPITKPYKLTRVNSIPMTRSSPSME